VAKLRAEREVLSGDVAVLRADLDTTRQERDRLLDEFNKAKAETERIRCMRACMFQGAHPCVCVCVCACSFSCAGPGIGVTIMARGKGLGARAGDECVRL